LTDCRHADDSGCWLTLVSSWFLGRIHFLIEWILLIIFGRKENSKFKKKMLTDLTESSVG
jgi:hypothetical protein